MALCIHSTKYVTCKREFHIFLCVCAPEFLCCLPNEVRFTYSRLSRENSLLPRWSMCVASRGLYCMPCNTSKNAIANARFHLVSAILFSVAVHFKHLAMFRSCNVPQTFVRAQTLPCVMKKICTIISFHTSTYQQI